MPESSPAALSEQNFRFLRERVQEYSGIVVEEDKRYLVESRLTPLVRELGLTSLDALCAALRGAGSALLAQQVAEAMTTNETSFFRDPAQYEAVRQELLPRLRAERASTRRLRFWSAAASAGQEAYSLALLLLEEGFGGWDIQILGTDLSSRMVERASRAEYQQLEVNRGLPAKLLVKYFHRAGVHWQLAEQARRLVHFRTFDLRQSLRSFGPFDLVFCRNVLIYFDPSTRSRLLREIWGTLFREGWLLLGGAETLLGMDDLYERRSAGGAVYYVPR